jgi:hypothetical protein
MEGSAGQNKSVGGPEMARGPALWHPWANLHQAASYIQI